MKRPLHHLAQSGRSARRVAAPQFISTLKKTALLTWGLAAAALLTSSALADHRGHDRESSLDVHGYQMVTNVVFVDPAQPGYLQVRFGGEGGNSHLGKMRGSSDDQHVNLATGVQSGHLTFEDENGDELVMEFSSPTAVQPDGRITFTGEMIVLDGTGRFARAKGNFTFDGWSRTTNPATGEGIGFFTIEGRLRGTKIDEDTPFGSVDRGTGTIINGEDFVYEGTGVATSLGRFQDRAQSTPGPFHSAFVGIVNGRFVLSSAFEAVWTIRHGDQLKFSAVEFISFELLTLPDGTPAPDLSKPSTEDHYYTVEGGTGRFRDAQGVIFGKGTFNPTSPTTVAAELIGAGFLGVSNTR